MRAALAGLLLLAAPLQAQTFGLTSEEADPLPDFSDEEVIEGEITVETLQLGTGVESILQPRVAPGVPVRNASGAVLRGLDKVSGLVTDLELGVGETARLGRLTVALGECRVPLENPTGDAFAQVRVEADGMERPAFDGWMIASSPALSALDHPRYDVWVIRCSST